MSAAPALPAPRPADPLGRRPAAWDLVVGTDPEQLAQLAKVWRSGGHVARSAATIALIAPNPTTPR